MEIGIVFALLAPVLFAAGDIFLRRGVLKAGESYTAVLVSLLIGVLFFSLLITFTEQWNIVRSLSWQVAGLLVGVGITHLAGGRFLFYSSVRLIGANKASAIAKVDIITAVALGIMFLNESFTIPLALGVSFILPGVILVSIEKKVVGAEEQSEAYRIQAKGVLSGLGAGLSWGISGVLIRPAVTAMGSPFVGAFVSFTVAFIIVASLLFGKGRRKQLVRLNRSSFIPIAISGTFSAVANLLRFTALKYSPVSLVQPLIAIHILYVLLFSFLLNRKIEVFTRKVIIGMVLAVAGAVILSL